GSGGRAPPRPPPATTAPERGAAPRSPANPVRAAVQGVPRALDRPRRARVRAPPARAPRPQRLRRGGRGRSRSDLRVPADSQARPLVGARVRHLADPEGAVLAGLADDAAGAAVRR